jgi:translocation and assembly module TamB
MKRATKIVLGVLAGIAGLGASAFGLLQTGWAKDRLAATLNASLSEPGSVVRIGRIEGLVPFDMRMTRIELADAGGTWLTVDRAALVWSPLALLTGRARIDNLSAASITVLRQPAPSGQSSESGFALPRLPVGVDLRRLAVDRFILSPAVVGGDNAEASISAHGLLTSDRADVSVNLTRTDGQPGSGVLEAYFDQAANRLALNLDIEEPTGILMDAAMTRTDHLPLHVTLNGDGPLSLWQGKLQLSAGRNVHSTTTIDIAKTGTTRFAIKGDAALGPLLADNTKPIVGNDFTFDIALTDDGKGAVTLAPSHLIFAAVTLEAEGARSDSGKLIGKAHIAAGDLAAVAPLAGKPTAGALAIDLTLAGTADRPKMTLAQQGQLTFGDIAIDGLTANAQADGKPGGTLQNPSFDIALDAKAANLRDAVTGGDYGPLTIHFAGSADAQGTAVSVKDLTADGGGVTVKAAGDFRNGVAEGKASIAAADLSVLGKLFGETAGGALKIDVDAKTSADRTFAVALKGTGDRLRTGIPAADALLAGATTLDAAGTRTADGKIALSKLTVTTGRANVSANGNFTPATGALDASLSANMPDLKALSTALSSPLAGNGSLTAKIGGTLDAPAIDADATFDRVIFGATRIDHVDAKVRSPDGLSGAMTVSGHLASGKLAESIDGTVAIEKAADGSAAYRVSQLKLAGSGGTVNAALLADPLHRRFTGKIDAAVGDLSIWSGVAGQQLTGQMSLAVNLPANGEPGPIKLALDKFALGASPHSIGIAHAGVGGSLSGDLNRKNATVDLVIAGLSANGGAITMADAHIAAKGVTTDFRMHAAGRAPDPVAVDMAGSAVESKGVDMLRLASFAAHFGKDSLALTKPATITIAPNAYRVTGLSLDIDGGTIAGDAALSPKTASADVTVRQLPLHPLAFLAGQPYVAGTLDGHLTMTGSPQRPAAHLTVATKGLDLQTDGPLPRPNLSLTADADWHGERADLNAKISTGSGDCLSLSGSAPFAFDLVKLVPGVPRNAELALKIGGSGRLENLTSIVPLGEDRITGGFTVDVAIGGTMAAPRPEGQIRVTGGHYANMALGTELNAIDLAIAGDGNRFRLDHLTATDGKTGKVQASGALDLGVSPAKVDFTLGFTDLLVARGDNMTIGADGDLKLDGTLKGMTASGTLKVRKAELYIPDRLPASVVMLDVHEIGGRDKGETTKAEPLAPVALKIALDAPGQIFVRGHGVTSEWRGHVDIGGTTAGPVLTGQLSVSNGSISLLGQNFNIDRGVIGFPGGQTIDPTLSVQASVTASSVTAQVNVTGTAQAPKIALSSTPALPRDEILARVLFGSNVGSLTPSQGIQLAAAAATLAQGGPGIMDKVRSTIGLDRLDLGAGGANPNGTQGQAKGTTVTGGKYIANGVFVGVQQGLIGGNSGSQAMVEVEITPNISVNSTFGSASGSGFGAKYSLDY